MTPRSLITVAVMLVLSAWCGFWAYGNWYAEPRDALVTRIGTFEEDVRKFDRKLAEQAEIEATLRSYADRTLGADRETVDHRLRTRLNRIGEELGVTPTVSTGRASNVQSPAKAVFKRQKALSGRVDFVELDASITLEGTLEQATALVHRIQAEPWLKQITQVAMKPKSNGERVSVTVRLRTLFMPKRVPAEVEHTAAAPEGLETYASITHVNPFRVPPPPDPPVPPPVVAQPEAAPATPSFPFAHWVMTGTASGPDGPEIWIRNHKSGETMILSVGTAWQGLVLERVDADSAVFRVDEMLVRIEVGSNLGDRRPVDL